MGMIKEFRTFATKGNLVDVAIAFVMGASFNTVITSFTGGIVSPIVGILTGKDLKSLKYVYRDAVTDAAGVVSSPEIVFQWGTFLEAILNFVIIAFVCFLLIKNVLRKDPNAAPDPTSSEILLGEIRDELRKK